MHLDISHLHPSLSANVVSFARLLREQGLKPGPQEQTDALLALQSIDLHEAEAFRTALRITLAKNRDEQVAFDALFPAFWNHLLTNPHREPEVEIKAGNPKNPDTPEKKEARPPILSIKDWLKGTPSEEEETEMVGYSPMATLTRKDFSKLSPDELRKIADLIRQLARPLSRRQSRRFQTTHRSSRLDIRRLIRKNLRRGGDLLDLVYHKHRPEQLKLVLLCDVSKSMDLYTLFLIQFVYAFQQVYRHIEVFVFSTALHRITPLLKKKRIKSVLDELPETVPDWGSGTRIGASLDTFLKDHLGLVTNKATVMILSDGWDTGELDILSKAMKTIHERAYHVIWLNPLMGYPGFKPTSGGLQAALPYIDLMAPAHNVESLRTTVRYLAAL